MQGSGISLGRWFGIPVKIDGSWFVIAVLLAWSFTLVFQAAFPDFQPLSTIVLGTITAVVFFVSVLLHEISHSVMARRLGVPVEEITLFIFGGVTRTSHEAQTARAEFAIAVVGPLTSLGLAAGFWALVNLTGELFPEPIRYGFGHLGWLNLGLGAFNLLPGFPLDGGRVLRSIVWHTTGSLVRATKSAVNGGRVVASVLIGIGLFAVLGGNLVGLWYAAIGWFLLQAASYSGQEMLMKKLFENLTASDLMSPGLVTLSSDTTVQDAIDDFFLRYDHNAFPVVDPDQNTVGILTLRAARQVPRDQWPIRQVWAVMTRLDEAATASPDTPMEEVIRRLRETEDQRVLVVDGSNVVGIITPRDIARWVQRSEQLGLTEVD